MKFIIALALMVMVGHSMTESSGIGGGTVASSGRGTILKFDDVGKLVQDMVRGLGIPVGTAGRSTSQNPRSSQGLRPKTN